MPELEVINLDQPQLGLRLQLLTAAGPVNVPGLQACYVDDEGDEILVSNDVLVMLGIDLERLLEQVALKAIRVDDALDTDRLDREDAASMPARSILESFSAERYERLEKIVKSNEIWHTVFRDTDLPADVEPMDIKLKKDASPYSCAGRKLYLYQERFVHLFGRQLLRDGVIELYKELLMFLDSSGDGFSIIITQVKKSNDSVPVWTLQHEPVACISGVWRGAQRKWSVIEQEAYPIVKACLDTDHTNLINVLASGQEWKPGQCGKLARWASYITPYRYTIEHIDGEHNDV
ncbi:hypothetical protein SPRG_08815 [Saprolegnia parasitica CBS 223.65]|uniref:Reverse transcriptase RNase H-like domain-containing protein n=1 Tax=Saprolegnia parasitica (strain CBS 223.65) TaxID=695850 RepID=A0A067C5T0_SAPPC|nr:hypothetical protein SPRG_08815 [Saprolegnia parasitica CBS 223.65]KDO25873.1 hypothetical protein SPRG_08815 [Saprolegnia parasitica CBS 223.65]|eukprot:XP_012203434.1 hypothetical protein SPRG_08815 [Saprolegnia parasitica CBS 223.65]